MFPREAAFVCYSIPGINACRVSACSSPQVWLNAFRAMLGEVNFFDAFAGSASDAIATALLVAYLMILTVMMLNLLVAVLTTAHARIDMNIDREYKVRQFSRVW